jgi:RNA polymerase sigma-70 factor (ECF subfamily)
MALTALDRTILQRCLNHEVGAWNDFVDRFLGLIYHVIHYTAHLRSTPISPENVEDLAQEILLQIVANDYAVLRQFRGKSSLATYLTVIARRVAVTELQKLVPPPQSISPEFRKSPQEARESRGVQAGIENLEQVQQLLKRLPARERSVVRLFYIEGRTYEEISAALNIPVNSIGPVLSRAKKRLRQEEQTTPSES